jgi:flagellar motor switch protein FliN
MAKQPTPLSEPDATDFSSSSDFELDNAIDNLRGALKADADGTTMESDFPGGSDFGGDFSGGAASSFGDFGANAAPGGFDFGAGPNDAGSAHAAGPLGSALASNYDVIMDIPIDVQIVLGSSRMQVSGLMNLKEGAIIALDKKIGEPVDITVNGRMIARGEITVLEGDDTRFGIRLTEVLGVSKD